MNSTRTVTTMIERLEPRRLLAAGLDPAFGDGGILITDVFAGEPGPDVANVVLPLPDGRVITAGFTEIEDPRAFAVAAHAGVLTRYHADGTLDVSFGQGGQVRVSVAGWESFQIYEAEFLGNGNILVRGALARSQASPDGQDFGVYGHGEKMISADGRDLGGGSVEAPSRPLRQSDGKVLISFDITVDDGDGEPRRVAAVRRLNVDGTPDTTFGDNGVARAPDAFGGGANAIGVRPDGRIFLIRHPLIVVDMVQFNADGSIDTTFGGGDGMIQFDDPAWDYGEIVAAPDGGFYATATSEIETGMRALLRLTPSGAIDPNFDISEFESRAGVQKMFVQDDGKIVVLFENLTGDTGPIESFLSRFNANGTRDATFGSDGLLKPLPPGQENRLSDVRPAFTPDGVIYAAGSIDGRFVTLRISDNPAPPPAAEVTATLLGDTLHVRGTAGNDVVIIRTRNDGRVEVESSGAVLASFSAADVHRIAVAADDGNDFVDARDLTAITTAGVDFPVTIDGGRGADVLVGHVGRDRITGGPDDDRIHGWDGNDWLSGNAQKDRVGGGAGDDSVLGNGGRDFVDGDTGDDTLHGGDQPDTLLGGDGADSVLGEGSHDRLYGGAGSDFLYGAGGNDTFFARDAAADTIIGGLAGTDLAQIDEEDDDVVGVESLL
jgi:uncharacterized delta-60 repeat protein